MEIIGCLALPHDVLARPGVADRVLELAGRVNGAPSWGPARQEVPALVV
jgi:hypothetical protein